MSARAALVNRASMSAQPVSLLCQYCTGILGPREGGGREGRTDRGGRKGEEREERRREQMSVVGGSCGPWSLTEMSAFITSLFAVAAESRDLTWWRVCFLVCNSQLSKWGCLATECRHNATVYKHAL